jgi:hypothetical protein
VFAVDPSLPSHGMPPGLIGHPAQVRSSNTTSCSAWTTQ